MQIVAATDFSTRSQRALRRAGLLARESGAALAVVHVVDDDQPAALVEIESREAARILEEQVGAIPELSGTAARILVIPGDPFDGILRAADDIKANLIVMGAHRKQLLRDIFVGTTIERVVRTGPRPVLMVNSEVSRPYRRVLAAIDLAEPSAHAIRTAEALGLLGDAPLALVHAFQPVAKGKMSFAGVDRDSIASYVEAERRRAGAALAEFLAASGLGDPAWSREVVEGEPFPAIAATVERMQPDLLVIGTHARSGIAKVLLGSVTEEALRSLPVDILAVPPLR